MVEDEHTMFPRPAWFPDARLNFAQNLLHPACGPLPDSLAVIAASETSRERVSWRDLRERVRLCTNALKHAGVRERARVAAYSGPHTNTLVAMLATTALGAIWTAVSPDTGVHAVLDRLTQVEPVVLFCDGATYYNGKVHEIRQRAVEITSKLPQLKRVIVFETVPSHPIDFSDIQISQRYQDFIKMADKVEPQTFAQLPADHPVYILFSSGTTGRPKCIVHGAAGTLIQHKKSHDIQASMRPGERFFYFTTTS